MTQPFRLAHGGRIDRAKPLRFRFDGRDYTGYAGDTLASALLANGVRVAGRSFKYHRPRGIVGAGVEECNVLVQLGRGARSTPNMRATEVELYDGLEARAVNAWPSSRFDLGAVNGLVSRFLPAGFYYKTFMWPDWHLYEGFIRRAAGLGRASREADPDRYESRFAHCDVLVVGSGPAGLAAAAAAAAGGARVILAEQDVVLGGSLNVDAETVNGQQGTAWAAGIEAGLAVMPEVRILRRTAVIGYQDHNSLYMVEQVGTERQCAEDGTVPRYRSWIVRAGRVILATGAIERPIVFPGNDRPGVMLAAAARHYVARQAVAPGRNAVLFVNNDHAYRTASALLDAGLGVAAVVDTRSDGSPALASALQARGIDLVRGGEIVGTRGANGLSGVRVRGPDRRTRWIGCDLLAVSGGYNPTIHLHSQSGGTLRYDEAIAAFVPDAAAQAATCVGMAAGETTLAGALAQGHAAGLEAAAAAGYPADSAAPVAAVGDPACPIEPCWQVSGGRGKAFVDLQHDVTADDVALSAQESFLSVEHLKRYTTLGMAPDQGKTSNVNALAVMASLTGRSIAETGTTRYRFPFTPAALGSFAGRNRHDLFRPLRRTPGQDLHVAAGAVFEDFGGWARPAYYSTAGEARQTAECREAAAVRSAAGLFDGSPLGKIEVKGRDAARFLDLVYANTMSTLKRGKVRYGLMLSEQGVVIDDGVATRLGDDHFLVGTSSGGAERIAAWMEEWLQCEWLDLDVLVAPVTSAWGVVTLTGPKARAILQSLGGSIDLAAAALPHMSFVEGRIAEFDVRLFRVSYTGETSFEINVPTRQFPALWDRVARAGACHGVVPIGIDAWDLLRTEKGYLHIGADTDGTTSALDLGWEHVLKKRNGFIGQRSLLRQVDQRHDRLQFVGFAVPEGEPPLPLGAHVVAIEENGDVSDGYVTSAASSPTLRRAVALGMLRGGRSRMGEQVTLKGLDGERRATVVTPTFYDPAGERLNG